tara:strand:+ start:14192 stop:22084 length:7893 start_codon:yes stop_codon:yes gene_type:complete
MSSFTRRFALISDGVLEQSTASARQSSETLDLLTRNKENPDLIQGQYFPGETLQESGSQETQPKLTAGSREEFILFGTSPVRYIDLVEPPTGSITINPAGRPRKVRGRTPNELARGQTVTPGNSGIIRVLGDGDNSDKTRVTFRQAHSITREGDANYAPEFFPVAPISDPDRFKNGQKPYQFKQRPTVFSKSVTLRAIQRQDSFRLQAGLTPPEDANAFAPYDVPPGSRIGFKTWNEAIPQSTGRNTTQTAFYTEDPVMVNGHVNQARMATSQSGHLFCFWLEGREIQPNFLSQASPSVIGKQNEPGPGVPINQVPTYIQKGQGGLSSSNGVWANHSGCTSTAGNICYSVCDPVDRVWSRPIRLTNIASASPRPNANSGVQENDVRSRYIQTFDVAYDNNSDTLTLGVVSAAGLLSASRLDIYASSIEDVVKGQNVSQGHTKPFQLTSTQTLSTSTTVSPVVDANGQPLYPALDIPDDLSIPGVGGADDKTDIIAIALEYLKNGSLAGALATRKNLYSITSIDNGKTFDGTRMMSLTFSEAQPPLHLSEWLNVEQFHVHLSYTSLDDGQAGLTLCASPFNSRLGQYKGGEYEAEDPYSGLQGSAVVSLFITSDGRTFSNEIELGTPTNQWAQGSTHGAVKMDDGSYQPVSWFVPDPSEVNPGYGLRTSSRVDAWECSIAQRSDGFIQVYVASANYGAPMYAFIRGTTEDVCYLNAGSGWTSKPYVPGIMSIRRSSTGTPYEIAVRRLNQVSTQPYNEIDGTLVVPDFGEEFWGMRYSLKPNDLVMPWAEYYQRTGWPSTSHNRLFTRTLLLKSPTSTSTQTSLLPNMSPLTGLQSTDNPIGAYRGAYATDWFPCNTSGQPEAYNSPAGVTLNDPYMNPPESTAPPATGTVDFRPLSVGFSTTAQYAAGQRGGRYKLAGWRAQQTPTNEPYNPYQQDDFVMPKGITSVAAIAWRGEIVVASGINQITIERGQTPDCYRLPVPWLEPPVADLQVGAQFLIDYDPPELDQNGNPNPFFGHGGEFATCTSIPSQPWNAQFSFEPFYQVTREGSLLVQSTNYWQPIDEQIASMASNSISGPCDYYTDSYPELTRDINKDDFVQLQNFRFNNVSLRATRAVAANFGFDTAIVPDEVLVTPSGGGKYKLADSYLLAGGYLGKFYQDCYDCWGRPDQQGYVDTFKWRHRGVPIYSASSGWTYQPAGFWPFAPNERQYIGGLTLYDAFTESYTGIYSGPILNDETNEETPVYKQNSTHGGFLEIAGLRNFAKTGCLNYSFEYLLASDTFEYRAPNNHGVGWGTGVSNPPKNMPLSMWNYALPNYFGAQYSSAARTRSIKGRCGLTSSLRIVVAVVSGGAAHNLSGAASIWDPTRPCATNKNYGQNDSIGGINVDVKLVNTGEPTATVHSQPHPPSGTQPDVPMPGQGNWDGGVSLRDSGETRNGHLGAFANFQINVCRAPNLSDAGTAIPTLRYAPINPINGFKCIVANRTVKPGTYVAGPPLNAMDHDTYVVGAGPQGDWVGHEDEVAVFNKYGNGPNGGAGDWEFFSKGFVQTLPTEDWSFNEGKLATYDSQLSSWTFENIEPSSDVYVQVTDMLKSGGAPGEVGGVIGVLKLNDSPMEYGKRDESRYDRPPTSGQADAVPNDTDRKYYNHPKFIEILVSTVQVNRGNEDKPGCYIKAVARVLDNIKDPDGLDPFTLVTNSDAYWPSGNMPDFGFQDSGYRVLEIVEESSTIKMENETEWIKFGHDYNYLDENRSPEYGRPLPGSDEWGYTNISRWKSVHLSRGDTSRTPIDNLLYTRSGFGDLVSYGDNFTNLFNNKGLQEYPWQHMNTLQVDKVSGDHLLRSVYSREMLGAGVTENEIPTPGFYESDSGLVNPLRPPTTSPFKGLEIESGMSINLLGGFIGVGDYQYKSSFVFPSSNLQESPLLNEWRGVPGRSQYVKGAYRTHLKANSEDLPLANYTHAPSKAAFCPDIEIWFDAGEDPSQVLNPGTKNQRKEQGKAGAFRGFRPEAFALMGHNSPGYQISFYQQKDQDPVTTFTCALGGDPVYENRFRASSSQDIKHTYRFCHAYWIPYRKLSSGRWSPTGSPYDISNTSGRMGVSIGSKSITVRPPDAINLEANAFNDIDDTDDNKGTPQERAKFIPWRPHQFKSKDPGTSWYCCIFSQDYDDDVKPWLVASTDGVRNLDQPQAAYNRVVFKIRDNSDTTLYFDAAVSDYFNSLVALKKNEMPDGKAAGGRQVTGIAIFSDRQMAQFDRISWGSGELYPSAPGDTQAAPDYSGCRYAKLTLFGCYRADKDETETRVGRFVTGFLANLSGPDVEWNWSTGAKSGVKINTAIDGTRRAVKNSPTRREFSMNWGIHRNANDPLWLLSGTDPEGKAGVSDEAFQPGALTPNRGFGTMPIGAEFSGKSVDVDGNPVPDWSQPPAQGGVDFAIPPNPKRVLLAVMDILSDPPANPAGTPEFRFIVGKNPSGAWVGLENKVVFWNAINQVWMPEIPADGDLVLIKNMKTYGLYSEGLSNWINAWEYMAVETYQQNKRSWQEILDLFESVQINAEPLVLAYEGDLVTTEWAKNSAGTESWFYRGSPIASDPCTIMMARIKSIGKLTNKGYIGQKLQTTDGIVCRPRPLVTINSVVFEEDF